LEGKKGNDGTWVQKGAVSAISMWKKKGPSVGVGMSKNEETMPLVGESGYELSKISKRKGFGLNSQYKVFGGLKAWGVTWKRVRHSGLSKDRRRCEESNSPLTAFIGERVVGATWSKW